MNKQSKKIAIISILTVLSLFTISTYILIKNTPEYSLNNAYNYIDEIENIINELTARFQQRPEPCHSEQVIRGVENIFLENFNEQTITVKVLDKKATDSNKFLSSMFLWNTGITMPYSSENIYKYVEQVEKYNYSTLTNITEENYNKENKKYSCSGTLNIEGINKTTKKTINKSCPINFYSQLTSDKKGNLVSLSLNWDNCN